MISFDGSPDDETRWTGVATAVGKAWIGQLWTKPAPDGVLFRISKEVPVGAHGHRDWRELAEKRGVYIRWPVKNN